MKRFVFFISIFLTSLLWISCSKEDKEIRLNKEKSVTIDLSDEPIFNTTPFIAQIIQSPEGNDVLLANFYDAAFIYFFDLTDGSLTNKIPIGKRRLEGFHYASKDSIFLLYSNQYNDGFIDSTNFVCIDDKGNIQEYYKINHPNIPNSDNDSIAKEEAFYPICRSTSLPANNDFVVFDLVKWYPEEIGTREFMDHKTPVLATYNFHKNKLNICKKYWYPGIDEGVYYPGQYHSYSTSLSKDGNPLSRFYFSGTLTEWDVKTNSLIQHQFKSRLLDSIPPISEPRMNFTNELEAQYRTISYDPYRQLYFSVLWFNPNIYGYGAYSLLVADENLNYQGEIFNPDIGTWSPLFTKDHLIGFSSDEEGILKVNFYTLDHGSLSQDDYISNIKDSLSIRKEKIENALPETMHKVVDHENVSLVDCLNGFTSVEAEKYVVVTVFVNEGCPACVDFALKALEGNKELFNTYPIYFLLTSGDKEKMNAYLSDYDLDDCNYLVKDDNGLVMITTTSEPSNPRIQFVENNSIVHDTIYSPEAIREAMIPGIFAFFGEDVETQVNTE